MERTAGGKVTQQNKVISSMEATAYSRRNYYGNTAQSYSNEH